MFIISCSNEKKTDEILQTTFKWEPGISAPLYYPVGSCVVDFGNAGHSSGMSFDNGWGEEYGGVVSGDMYKEVPTKVDIKYNSAVENYLYHGEVNLDQEKILRLFRKYCTAKSDIAHLTVGMAPGGWVRIWFNIMTGNEIDNTSKFIHIEIAKAQLKGNYDDTSDENYKLKNLKNWGKYYIYWQHHGIPYEVWANNEKEYDIVFDFDKPNPNNEVTDPQYSSLDGTLYYRTPIDSLLKRKLPVDLVAVWKSKKNDIYYDTHVTFPKNFSKIIEDRKLSKVVLSLQIEKDDQSGVIYLIGDKGKENYYVLNLILRGIKF